MTSTPRLLELFAGYGGLGMAVEEVLGAATTAVAEVEAGPCRVLEARFPSAPNLGDVTCASWGAAGSVDIVSGGSPCQDIAHCGPKAGMIAGRTRSGLWASMRDAVATLRPRFVVWENVRAATTAKASALSDPDGRTGVLRALGRVLGDLSSMGYDAEWRLVRASDVGAAHQRARIFLLAWDRAQVPALHPGGDPFASWDTGADLFHLPATGLFPSLRQTYADKLPVAGAMRHGDLILRPELPAVRGPKLLPTPRTTDTNGAGLHGAGGMDLRTVAALHLGEGFGDYTEAVHRHADTFSLEIPAPLEDRPEGGRRLSAGFVEFLMTLPPGWVTDPGLGLSRSAQIKALGNGVVPAQAARALQVMVADAGVVSGSLVLAA